MSDKIIWQVRAIREQHAASFNYDLDLIFADLKVRQEKHAAEGWVIVAPPTHPPSEASLTLQRARFAGIDQAR